MEGFSSSEGGRGQTERGRRKELGVWGGEELRSED